MCQGAERVSVVSPTKLGHEQILYNMVCFQYCKRVLLWVKYHSIPRKLYLSIDKPPGSPARQVPSRKVKFPVINSTQPNQVSVPRPVPEYYLSCKRESISSGYLCLQDVQVSIDHGM